ncbi:carbohydrate porin (plasmid) [Verrucomicrobiaceae bacterium 227]
MMKRKKNNRPNMPAMRAAKSLPTAQVTASYLLAGCVLVNGRQHSESASPRPGYDLPSDGKLENPVPRAGLTGDWGGLRTRLVDRGISPYAVFAAEVFSNVDGGFRSGTSSPGLLDFGVGMDLEKLIGWKGAGFTATAFAAYGDDGSAKYIGDFNVASNLFSATDFNLFNLFFSQTFADESVFLKVGQIAADDDFMGSDTAGLFLNSAFGPLPTESGNVAAPIFPLTAPGAFIRITPSGTFSFHTGIYAGDSGPSQSGNHGFDWRTGGTAGWVTFAEADYNYASGTAKLGGYYHTGDFENFKTGGIEEGQGAVYGIIDHRFIESNDGPGLAAFARLSFATKDERSVVSHYFDAGIALDHLFAEDDALGLGISYTRFGDDYLNAHPGLTSSETILELTYQRALSEWCILQSGVQYLIDPHESGDNALVLGLRTEISF